MLNNVGEYLCAKVPHPYGIVVNFRVVILGMITILGGAWTYLYTFEPHDSYQHQYRPKECFAFKNKLDNTPDGVIKVVHDHEYTVLWTKEAERRYAGPKTGGVIGMKWLDSQTFKVPCPKGW